MTKISNRGILPSAALSRALNLVGRASGKIDPAYEMVQLEVKNGKLSVRCFNGTMGILTSIPVEDQGNGFDAIISAQAFASLVSSMNGAVTLRPESRKGLRVECGSVSVARRQQRGSRSHVGLLFSPAGYFIQRNFFMGNG